MTGNFRLLSATGRFGRRYARKPNIRTTNDATRVEFSQKPDGCSEEPWVSVVIGKNGVGKSRLLAGIADLFAALDRGTSYKPRQNLGLFHLEYVVDTRICVVDIDTNDNLSATIDGNKHDPRVLPLPTKVIALTTTPFDKFRISRSLLQIRNRVEPEIPERYTYLGLRDRTGRASPTAAIFRALEGLFEASRVEGDRRHRVAEVFGFLGYKPYVEVRYEFSSVNKKRLEQIVSGSPIESILMSDKESIFQRPLERMLHRDSDLLIEIRIVAAQALARSLDERSFTLKADFDSYSEDENFFQRVQILRRADLIRMSSAVVERMMDGTVIDLRLASSGELGIVTGFLGLASVIEEGSLIFVDEPEISLHPEWQSRYVDLLLRTFGRFNGCHFVLATHSPLILSDISPNNSNVVLLDAGRRIAEDAEGFAGQSSDYLLATAFQVPGKNNLYLKQEIIKALRLAADGLVETSEFSETMDRLLDLLPSLGEDSSVAKLIRELQEAKTGGTTSE
jgi:predicted ATPase